MIANLNLIEYNCFENMKTATERQKNVMHVACVKGIKGNNGNVLKIGNQIPHYFQFQIIIFF